MLIAFVRNILGKLNRNHWGWSYCVIILVSILTNLIGYFAAISVLTQELERSGLQSAVYTRDMQDSYFNAIQNSVYGILQSNPLQKLMASDDMPAVQRNELSKEIGRSMQSILYNTPAIERFMVILRDKDMGIDAGGMGNLDLMYHAYFRDAYASKQQWLDHMFDGEFQKICILDTEESGAEIYMFYTLPTIMDHCMAVLKLSPDRVSELLGNENLQSGANIFVTDQQGRLLFSSTKSMLIGDTIELQEDSTNTEGMIDGTKCVLSQISSENMELVYIYAIPLEHYLHGIRVVRAVFILGFILCLILGGTLARVFTLVLNRRMERQFAFLRSNTLEQLLEGSISVSHYSDPILQKCGLDLAGEKYLVFIIAAEEAVTHEALAEEMAAALSREVEDNRVFMCRFNGEYAGIISFYDGTPDMEQLMMVMNNLCAQLSDEMELFCSLSLVSENLIQVRTAYEQAAEAMSYRFIEPGHRVYVYDNIAFLPKWNIYTQEIEGSLLTAISSGDSGTAFHIINRLLNCNEGVEAVNLCFLSVRSAEIISTVLKADTHADEVDMDRYRALYVQASKINNVRRFAEVKQEILELAEKLCQENLKILNSKQGIKSPKYKQVAEYIEENYTDPMLSVGVIADEFRMDRFYLSRNFKKEFGIGVFDYIVTLRLKKAKELLKTPMNIDQIAQETGFPNSRGFRYAFKKYESVTPAQYRQIGKQ